MTQKDPSDFDPKHRIIGAIIIVSLAVIFVPMILDRHPSPDPSTVGDIPAPTPESENKVVVTPVPPPTSAKSSAPPVEAPKVATAPSVPKPEPTAPKASSDKPVAPPAKTAMKESSSAPAKPASKPAPKTPEPKAAEVKSGWVVQVGTFASASNATRLEEQLKKHGHVVTRERITRDGANALRLRVGPFKDKALALKAQGQIQKETGVLGVVLAYP